MDIFLHRCYKKIIDHITFSISPHIVHLNTTSEGLHALVQTVNNADIIFNYNGEGRLHSKYLNDRYEPAITISYEESIIYWYLFDGEIKDCIHPFMIRKKNISPSMFVVWYYSSERIEQGLPIVIHEYLYGLEKYYYRDPSTIDESHYSNLSITNKDEYIGQLHDRIPLLKFAD